MRSLLLIVFFFISILRTHIIGATSENDGNEELVKRNLNTEVLRDDTSWILKERWMSSEWAKKGGDIFNTGLCKTCDPITQDATGNNYLTRWKISLPSGIRSVIIGPDSGKFGLTKGAKNGISLETGGRALYVTTKAGILYKISRTTGKIIWQRDLQGGVGLGGPVALGTDYRDQVANDYYNNIYVDGKVMVGTANGLLWIIGEDGVVAASKSLYCATYETQSCQVLTGSSMYGLGDSQVTLTYTRANTGNADSSDLNGATYWIATQPLGGAVDHFILNGALNAVKTAENKWSSNWKFTVAGTNNGYGFTTSPTLGPDQTAYVGSDKMYALTAKGSLLWSFNDNDAAFSIVNSAAVYNAGSIYFGAMNNKFYALDAVTGMMRWSFTATGAFQCTASITPQGNLLSSNNDGYLYALSPTGSLFWRVSVPGAVRSASITVVKDGSFYFAGSAFDPTGRLKWSFSDISGAPNTTYAAAAPQRDGTVYMGSEAGDLYAIGGNTPDPQTLFLEQLSMALQASLGTSNRGHSGIQAFQSWADFTKLDDGVSYARPVCNEGGHVGDYFPVDSCGDGCLTATMIGFSIKCSQGKLVHLALIGGLYGSYVAPYMNASVSLALPSSIGGLSGLTALNLWCTRATQIPSEIGLLTDLRFLKIGCSVTSQGDLHPPSPGTIPSQIGYLTNLNRLYIGGGFHRNDLPTSIGNLVGLQELYIDRVSLTQTGIPPSLGGLASLTVLTTEVPNNTPSLNTSSPCLPPFLQQRISAGAVRTKFGYIRNLNDDTDWYSGGTGLSLQKHYKRYMSPWCIMYKSTPIAAPAPGVFFSAYPASGGFPNGAAVDVNKLLGVAALPLRYEVRFSVNPSASFSSLRTLLLLTSNAQEYGQWGTSLPRVSFCSTATGMCPSLGLEVVYYTGIAQATSVYTNSQAMTTNAWTTVIINVDAAARTMSVTMTGGMTFSRIVALPPATPPTWDRVEVYASSPWANLAYSNLRDLSVSAIAGPAPPILSAPSAMPTRRTHYPSPLPTTNAYFKMKMATGTSVFFTRHVDQSCKLAPFGMLYPLSPAGAQMSLGTCTAGPDGVYFKLACKLGPKKYSLDKATYTDSSCATVATSKGVIQHDSVCAWDAKSGGFLRIHCGEDELPNYIPQIKLGVTFSSPLCDAGKLDWRAATYGRMQNVAYWTGVCSPRYYSNSLRGLVINYNYVLEVALGTSLGSATSTASITSTATTKAATTSESTTVTVASAAGISVGSVVSAAGIAAGTTVTAVSGNTITISAPATETSTGTTVGLTATTTSGLVVYELRYDASDVFCERRVLYEKTIRYPAPPATGSVCAPDVLDKDRYFLNSAAGAVIVYEGRDTPAPTARPTRAYNFNPTSAPATVAPSAAAVKTVIFTENFDGYTDGDSSVQRITGLIMYTKGTVWPGWTWTSTNDWYINYWGPGNIDGPKAQMRDTGTNKALVLAWWQGLTQNACMVDSNHLGWIYSIEFDVAPGTTGTTVTGNIYDTRASDTFLVKVLRADGTTMRSFGHSAGSFSEGDSSGLTAGLCLSAFSPTVPGSGCRWDRARFSYMGDGNGDVKLQFYGDCARTNVYGRVCAAIDNLVVKIVSITPTTAPTRAPTAP